MAEVYGNKNEYICDDRGVWENIQKVKSMTDEEFEKYIEGTKEKENTK